MSHSLRLSPAVLLIVACALWGAATVLNKALLASLSPVTLLVLQLAPSAFVLWVVVLITGVPRSTKSVLIPLILLGILNPGISYTLSLMGLARISASVTTLLWAAEPLMILALAAIVLKETFSRRLFIVMLFGGFGVTLVADVFGRVTDDRTDLIGIVLLLSAVLCCAFYTVFSRKLSDDVDPLFAVAVQQSAGLFWATTLLLANSTYGSAGDIKTVPWSLIAAAAVSGLLYYAAAYWLYITALRFVPAGVAGSYFNVIPIFGVAFAFVFLDESLSLVQWMGAAMILMSVFELVRLTQEVGSRPTNSV